MPIEEMLARNPKAIILSGGPSSVYADGAPGISDEVFTAGVPVFGMCYGFQLMAKGLGGEVSPTGAREYGRTPVRVSAPDTLLADVPAEHRVWMSHGDRSEEHTAELQSLMRISYAVFCLKKNKRY